MPYPAEVQAALDRGELWRAKEILEGQIGTLPYDPYRYEWYGTVLLQMGDLIHAGRYLFLSGRRGPEYQAAIRLFLTRHGGQGWQRLVSQFPARARTLPLHALPALVQRDLADFGAPLSPPTGPEPSYPPPPPVRVPLVAKLVLALCVLVGAFLVVALLEGVPVLWHQLEASWR